MDKNRIVGSRKQIKGAVKQAGKAVGGVKVQNTICGLKDTLKGK